MTVTAALLAVALAQPYGPPPYPPPYPPPPPSYQPPPPPYPPPPTTPPPPRGVVGLVFLPLGSARLSTGDYPYEYEAEWHGAVALEVRSSRPGPASGARLRLGGEFSEFDRVVDASLKYNFLDPLPVQPFLTIGAGGARLGPESSWRGAFTFSGGLDIYLTPNLFFSAELKARTFTSPSSGSASNVYGSHVSQWIGLFGFGAYL